MSLVRLIVMTVITFIIHRSYSSIFMGLDWNVYLFVERSDFQLLLQQGDLGEQRLGAKEEVGPTN